MATFADDVIFLGDVTFTGAAGLSSGFVTNDSVHASAGIARSKLGIEALQAIDIPLADWLDADSLQPLPSTSSGTDLGRYAGTYGTDAPLIRTADLKALGLRTLRMRAQVMLPYHYVAGDDFRIRLFAGMVTTAADTVADIDLECREITGAGVGSDICATSIMTMNSTTFASKDFVMDTGAATPGKSYDVRVTLTVNDGATGTAVIAGIARSSMMLNVRG
jgi:hypothetical protein